MNFDESVKYLYDLGNEVSAMKLGLENISKLLSALGTPQNNFLKIQVAGTNGKGSTCAFLDAICVSAGIKTGLYTSPHLVSITERIKVGGQEISEKDFARHATEVKEISEKLVQTGELETVPTFFEQVTAIALNTFAEAKIELAILETGLGGRFDATTAANAEIAAITPIDYDHQEFLGETLAEIAAEKAAIIGKYTKRVVSTPQKNQEIINQIWLKCEENNLEPIWATTNLEQNSFSVEEFSAGLSFNTAVRRYSEVYFSLPGRHQFTNAILAVRAAEILVDFCLDISQENIIDGLKKTNHKGRLEFNNGILFDGAHNVAGAKALKEYLDEFITQPITMIFGAMRDKDLAEIGEILFPKAETLILTKPDNPRSMETVELLKFVPKNCDAQVFEMQTVAESVEKAREISPKNNLILITGSLYLVGEAQKILKNESEI